MVYTGAVQLAGVGRAAGGDAGDGRRGGRSIRQGDILTGQLEAAHLLLAELLLHIPFE